MTISLLPSGGWSTPLMDQIVLAKLVRLLQPGSVLEVGSFRGYTTRLLAENASPTTEIHALDIKPNHGEAYSNTPLAGRIKRLIGSLDKWPLEAAVRRRYDFIFLDADHQQAAVESDTRHLLRMLAEDGLLLWHDYADWGWMSGWNRVPEVLHAFSKERPILGIPGTSLAVYRQGWTEEDVADSIDAREDGAENPAAPRTWFVRDHRGRGALRLTGPCRSSAVLVEAGTCTGGGPGSGHRRRRARSLYPRTPTPYPTGGKARSLRPRRRARVQGPARRRRIEGVQSGLRRGRRLKGEPRFTRPLHVVSATACKPLQLMPRSPGFMNLFIATPSLPSPRSRRSHGDIFVVEQASALRGRVIVSCLCASGHGIPKTDRRAVASSWIICAGSRRSYPSTRWFAGCPTFPCFGPWAGLSGRHAVLWCRI